MITYTCKGQVYTLYSPDWTAIADAWISPDFMFAAVRA
jgi:hypothetical protein